MWSWFFNNWLKKLMLRRLLEPKLRATVGMHKDCAEPEPSAMPRTSALWVCWGA